MLRGVEAQLDCVAVLTYTKFGANIRQLCLVEFAVYWWTMTFNVFYIFIVHTQYHLWGLDTGQ